MNIGQSQFIINQIPEYIKSEYPLFVDFVKAYYEYMDQSGKSSDIINNVMVYSDIDETLDSFLKYFRNDLIKDIPHSFACDERLFLKHVKELYTSKGSEASYKLLFRALYNKEISFYSPINNILRPSDGKWEQEYSITVKIAKTYTLDQINSAKDREILIEYNAQNIYIPVVKIKYLSEDVTYRYVEFFLLKDFAKIAKISNIPYSYNAPVVLTNYFQGTLLPTLANTSIMTSGLNIREGLVYDIDPSQGSNGKILIKQTINSAINDAEIINFGYGYYNTFQQIISPQNNTFATASVVLTNGVVTNINLIDGGSGYTVAPSIRIIGDGIGAVAHCTISGGSVTGIVIDYGGHGYSYTPSVIFDESSAVIKFNIGTVRKYPGFYVASDSLISDDSYLQDGYYYQTYSYVIEVDELFSKYKNILKKILHPSGYKLFGAMSQYDSKQLISQGIPVSAQVSLYPFGTVFVYDSISWLFELGLISDTIDSINSNQIISYSKNVTDSVDFTNPLVYEDVYVRRILGINDTNLSILDATSTNVSKSVSDSFTLGETVSIPPFKTLFLNDSFNVFGTGQNDTYGTAFNTDYFSADYIEEPLGIVFPA